MGADGSAGSRGCRGDAVDSEGTHAGEALGASHGGTLAEQGRVRPANGRIGSRA